ncbi:MAG: glycosyltransferase [Deltaproteobacteria bacterium]|nr:glycosyltransferase [Deltaproteobacteria bacterium]
MTFLDDTTETFEHPLSGPLGGSARDDIVAGLEEQRPEGSFDLSDYEAVIGGERMDEIKRLAEPLTGRTWVNVNSASVGGGVAEMLRSAVPFAQALGLSARWCTIRGNDAFFQVTKKFHNLLQGADGPITLDEIFGAYLDTIEENARDAFIAADLTVLHDPQPAAMIMNAPILGKALWRCHIDTSIPNKAVWRFLLPYINQYDGAIFTTREFVGPGLKVPVYEIMPCIDPLAPKNRQYTRSEALDILQPLFTADDVDPERPIFAAISRCDRHKNQGTILKAFSRLVEERPRGPKPYLLFIGNTATDDPEGEAVLNELRQQAGDSADVRFWVNVEDNDRVVGALMRIARGFVHVSTREGFGLVVAEALWQGAPVIGSRVGGIQRQIIDGVTGHLVEPLDADAIAARMAAVLDDEDAAAALGREGREHVRRNFLLPELVKRYLILMRYYLGRTADVPPFTYREVGNGADTRACSSA